MPMTIDGIKQLKIDEGFRADVYRCPAGYRTIGYGHNLDAWPLRNINPPLTEAVANEILLEDINKIDLALKASCPAYLALLDNKETVRAEVLINMAFNMGVSRLLGFKKTLRYIMDMNYIEAAQEMLKSTWNIQVGKRAIRQAWIFYKGTYKKLDKEFKDKDGFIEYYSRMLKIID